MIFLVLGELSIFEVDKGVTCCVLDMKTDTFKEIYRQMNLDAEDLRNENHTISITGKSGKEYYSDLYAFITFNNVDSKILYVRNYVFESCIMTILDLEEVESITY